MRISERFIEEIKSNNDLSLDLAKKVGISQSRLKKVHLITTIEVLQMVQGIILSQPIGEHDVFDSLKEFGFEYKLVGFQHITDDKELISYGYRWIL